MANRPQGEGLEGLTPERLEAMAHNFEQRIAGIHETAKMIGAATDDTRTRMGADLALYAESAALCRAVADTQRRIVDGERVEFRYRKTVAGPSALLMWTDATSTWEAFPSLAAALASIHPEAGGTV